MRETLRRGDPFIWLTGGALATSLLMIAGLLLLVTTRALGFFWPAEVVRLTLEDGARVLGQIRDEETPRPLAPEGRLQIQVGNRDIYGADFRWIDRDNIVGQSRPESAAVLERTEWGNFYGFVRAVRTGGETRVDGAQAWAELQRLLPAARDRAAKIHELQAEAIGDLNREMESARLEIEAHPDEAEEARHRLQSLQAEYEKLRDRLDALVARGRQHRVVLATVDGRETELPVSAIVRAYRPNALGTGGKLRVYAARVWEFVSGDPRESNTEGGVFPAIFGTVMMVMIMTVAVVPFGVLAALYLREYAREGWFVRAVRIAINNLAGVPSIVFGVFGLGFFVYVLGGSIDALFFPERLPNPTFGTGGILWASLTLALLTVPVVVVATEEALVAVPRETREGSLALGATKFETVWRVVLPQALPGVMTGVILAMARGAGEVAPLMLTGVVKLAPSLPVDDTWPFFHLERKFMHLGFHIYDVGFQSPNVEAAKPMVYATTLLLVGIVVMLNLAAILIRNRLRRRLTAGTF